jgi:anhydro-N-acetylmuramic acid kinase
MLYKAIGVMSGSSLDGLDLAYVHFEESGGKWAYNILHTACIPYSYEWLNALKAATSLTALDYQLLHTAYGHYIGNAINGFIEKNHLQHQVDLIASHGHTSFHVPEKKMTAQLGDGAAIAAATQLPVISDLRAMDIAFGGQGAPIVPIGEKFLFAGYEYFLNIGGIANLTISGEGTYSAFDVCPANRVLNLLVQPMGKAYDEDGKLASMGKPNSSVIERLNQLPFYHLTGPKSLDNDFGIATVYPILNAAGLSVEDAASTYVEHIAIQIKNAIQSFSKREHKNSAAKLLVTGGGALNCYLVNRIQAQLQDLHIELELPDAQLINYKEALIMALIGVLRWREEYNVMSAVTGAKRNSINGAIWMGVQA